MPDTWYPAVEPPDSLRERLLAEADRVEKGNRLLAPWDVAARLRAIADGRPL